MLRTVLITILALTAVSLLVADAGASGGNDDGRRLKYKAKFFGDGLSGHAVYRERDRSEGRERRFAVEIEDAAAHAAYDVFVNGAFIDVIVTNALGRGELKYRTAQFIDGDDEDWTPMPDGFPALRKGDTVTVGGATGVLFNRSDNTRHWKQKYRLEGEAETGDDELEVEVKYRERCRWGKLRRRFEVEIEDAEPGSVFDVLVNGTYITTLVMGNDDELEFELRTPEFIDDEDDGEPMPDDFPSLQPGDVVQVGPLSVVLQIDD